MASVEKKINWMIWVGLLLVLATLALGLTLVRLRSRGGAGSALPVYGTVAEFALTNQNGQAVSLENLRGHVWVADIIFTRCAGPCLKMSRQLRDLQNALPPGSQARFVSLTTDPDYDTPPVLATYAKRFDADPTRWFFLTGTKAQIAKLATDSLKLTAIEKKPAEREDPADLFIHSTILVLVDKQARLRGVYETTGETVDPETIRAELVRSIHRLERE